MLPNGKNIFRWVSVAVLVMCGTMSVARSSDDNGKHDDGGKVVRFTQTDPRYQQECATCHIAYPPGLLSTDSWRKIMAGLDNHFGSDASLSAKENEEITAILVDNSCDFWGAEVSPLRITETDWFQREHNSYVIPPETWKNPVVKSPANCPACHLESEHGDFSERYIRLPK